MVVILAIGSVLLVAVLVSLRLSRPESGTIVDHQRSLAALSDAVRPRSPSPVETTPPVVVTDHVHILDAPPTGRSGPHRRARTTPRRQPVGRQAKGRRRSAADIAGRPTIASLPTMVSIPREWLPAPPDQPAPEPAPVSAQAFAPDEAPVAPDAPRPVAWQPIAVSPRRWYRSTVRTASVLGVLGLGMAAVVVAGTAHGSHGRAATQRPPSRPAARPARVTTTRPPPPPTTTVARVISTTAGNGSVTVVVPFTVTLAPTGRCWVSVRVDSGKTLFEGTLNAGQLQHVVGSGPLVVRLGNTSAMTMMLNGAQLDLSGIARTANINFVST